MRYLTIVHGQVDRVATEDFSLGGELIRAGDFLLMNLPAGIGTLNSSTTRPASTPIETRVATWALAMAHTNASDKISPASKCRSHSPRWRADCPG